MHPSMIGQGGRREGRGRPNGRACYPPDPQHPPEDDPHDPADPPYYVQDLNKQRSLDDVKKVPEEYRHVPAHEPLYHQPPTPLETQDRYQGGCVGAEVPGLGPAGGSSLTSPYFAQHQLRMSQSGGRRFSPLRLPGVSKSSWRRCSWRCTTVVFVCVTLCLAATTTFFATSQVGVWHTAGACVGEDLGSLGIDSSPAVNLPASGQPGSQPDSPFAPPRPGDVISGAPRGRKFVLRGSGRDVGRKGEIKNEEETKSQDGAGINSKGFVPHVPGNRLRRVRSAQEYHEFDPQSQSNPHLQSQFHSQFHSSFHSQSSSQPAIDHDDQSNPNPAQLTNLDFSNQSPFHSSNAQSISQSSPDPLFSSATFSPGRQFMADLVFPSESLSFLTPSLTSASLTVASTASPSSSSFISLQPFSSSSVSPLTYSSSSISLLPSSSSVWQEEEEERGDARQAMTSTQTLPRVPSTLLVNNPATLSTAQPVSHRHSHHRLSHTSVGSTHSTSTSLAPSETRFPNDPASVIERDTTTYTNKSEEVWEASETRFTNDLASVIERDSITNTSEVQGNDSNSIPPKSSATATHSPGTPLEYQVMRKTVADSSVSRSSYGEWENVDPEQSNQNSNERVSGEKKNENLNERRPDLSEGAGDYKENADPNERNVDLSVHISLPFSTDTGKMGFGSSEPSIIATQPGPHTSLPHVQQNLHPHTTQTQHLIEQPPPNTRHIQGAIERKPSGGPETLQTEEPIEQRPQIASPTVPPPTVVEAESNSRPFDHSALGSRVGVPVGPKVMVELSAVLVDSPASVPSLAPSHYSHPPSQYAPSVSFHNTPSSKHYSSPSHYPHPLYNPSPQLSSSPSSHWSLPSSHYSPPPLPRGSSTLSVFPFAGSQGIYEKQRLSAEQQRVSATQHQNTAEQHLSSGSQKYSSAPQDQSSAVQEQTSAQEHEFTLVQQFSAPQHLTSGAQHQTSSSEQQTSGTHQTTAPPQQLNSGRVDSAAVSHSDAPVSNNNINIADSSYDANQNEAMNSASSSTNIHKIRSSGGVEERGGGGGPSMSVMRGQETEVLQSAEHNGETVIDPDITLNRGGVFTLDHPSSHASATPSKPLDTPFHLPSPSFETHTSSSFPHITPSHSQSMLSHAHITPSHSHSMSTHAYITPSNSHSTPAQPTASPYNVTQTLSFATPTNSHFPHSDSPSQTQLQREERMHRFPPGLKEGLQKRTLIPLISTSGGEHDGRVNTRQNLQKQDTDDAQGNRATVEGSERVLMQGNGVSRTSDSLGGAGGSYIGERVLSLGRSYSSGRERHGSASLDSSLRNEHANTDLRDYQARPPPSSTRRSEGWTEMSYAMTAGDNVKPTQDLSHSPHSSLSLSQSQEKERGGGGGSGGERNEEALNNRSEEGGDLTPLSGSDTSGWSNGNSYASVGGSLALPMAADSLLLDPQTHATGDQVEVSINDVAAKDQRNKTIEAAGGVSPAETEGGDIDLPLYTTQSGDRKVIPPVVCEPGKSIESREKQSGPGASSGSGHRESKESSIDSVGSEANQGHSLLSRSNQRTADPNHESSHVQVSSRDGGERRMAKEREEGERRERGEGGGRSREEDKGEYPSWWSDGSADVESNAMGAERNDYDEDYIYDADGETERGSSTRLYGEGNSKLGEEGFWEVEEGEGKEEWREEEGNNSEDESIGKDEPGLKGIPEGSLDRALESSLLDEERNSGFPDSSLPPPSTHHRLLYTPASTSTHAYSPGATIGGGVGNVGNNGNRSNVVGRGNNRGVSDRGATSESGSTSLYVDSNRSGSSTNSSISSSSRTDNSSSSMGYGSSDSGNNNISDISTSDSTNNGSGNISSRGSDSRSGSRSSNSSTRSSRGGWSPGIMLPSDPVQSEARPCKCFCQCDGGVDPALMPGRVGANLNSGTIVGAGEHVSIPSLPPSQQQQPPLLQEHQSQHQQQNTAPNHEQQATPHHRHRHHHGEDKDLHRQRTHTLNPTLTHTQNPTQGYFTTTIMIPYPGSHQGEDMNQRADIYERPKNPSDVVVETKLRHAFVDQPAVTHVYNAPTYPFLQASLPHLFSTSPQLLPTTPHITSTPYLSQESLSLTAAVSPTNLLPTPPLSGASTIPALLPTLHSSTLYPSTVIPHSYGLPIYDHESHPSLSSTLELSSSPHDIPSPPHDPHPLLSSTYRLPAPSHDLPPESRPSPRRWREGATIDASLTIDSRTQGGRTRSRPSQTAPPDGASFSALTMDQLLVFNLSPYGYWNLHLTLNDPTDIWMNLTKPRGTSLGLYARRNTLPTHTQHDIMKVLRETKQRDVSVSQVSNTVQVWVEEMLSAGDWFLTLYNDDGDPHQVSLVISRGPGGGECPGGCRDRGHCILGRCHCFPGFSGADCSMVVCKVLCSGHGEYVGGECRCNPGYKGRECQLRRHECEVPDCNGRGQCHDGHCLCGKGFTGEFCQDVDCPHPTCSDNGFCVNGTCNCKKGWSGPECNMIDPDAHHCFPDCSHHGAFSLENHTCVCNPPWTGSDCSKKSCSLNCGQHGRCENDACTCDEGWTGENCSEKLCDARCSEHGQCKNGTCVCMTGWNGRHCTLSGCPGNCRDRGRCEATGDGTWYCSCQTGWDGPDCSDMLETQCNDRLDNDNDGLVDCQDPECCNHTACSASELCVSRASSPIDILLRKQPPAETASFFEKMKFLIEENSLQHFTNSTAFNMRRAAVVRGRVVTKAGRGVVSLRVVSLEEREGFTLTRQDGSFDIMVNGGGTVILSFGKHPFSPQHVQVLVPWNEVVVLDDIVMTVAGLTSSPPQSLSLNDPLLPGRPDSSVLRCPSHDYDLFRPVVMATWQNVLQGECPETDAILVEAQAVQESVQIPGTGMYLVYHSSRVKGYESTIRLQLTPENIPDSLRRVHLRIVLEGTLFTRVFEADPSLKFTYAWDRLNVYRQRVYGVTVARVSVGYEHAPCQGVIWEHQTVRVAGMDLRISRVGGFNLHVHHTYNYHQGILQKGDGQNIYLGGQRRLVTTLLGTGDLRDVVCSRQQCEGRADQSRLLAPTCLAAAPDGSLYVGDFNLIRRVKPDGTVSTVAMLNETRVSYRYHVAVSPLDGSVYVSDPEAYQVLRLIPGDPSSTSVVGSGQRCLPGDRNKCGDGGLAIHARLTYPKGLAISSKGELFIADGTNIRVVSSTGIISTLIGGHDHRSHWAPVPCNGTVNLDQLHLRWPTELAISPLDSSLHILDDHLILRITPDDRVQVLSGRSLNCPTPPHDPPDASRTALLLNPQSIAFSPQGELYVAESDSQRINRVRIITSDGRIVTYAGADSHCNCRDTSCFCHAYDNVSATSAVFSSISSIAVTPDGVLHISDQEGYRVRSVKTVLPKLNEQKHYLIHSPDSHEVYIFNRFGMHQETRNLVTGQTIYKFQYTTHTNDGKLLSVSDGTGNSFRFIRNSFGEVTAIDNPQKQRVKIRLSSPMRLLEQLVAPTGYNITFRYHDTTHLMRSKIEAVGRSYSFDYDAQGRLTRAVLPTGQVIQLNFDLNMHGAEVVVTRDGKNPVRTRVRGNTLTHTSGPLEAVADVGSEGQLRIVTDWRHEVSLERTSYKVLESTSQIAAEMFPVLSRQQTHIGGELVNRYEWIYSPATRLPGTQGMKVSGTLRVNGAALLTLTYDPLSSSEALLFVSGQKLVNITYDQEGRPVHWVPVAPLVPSNVTYDHWGHITLWQRGNLSEQYNYDSLLRLESVVYADGARVNYDYREKYSKPEKVTHPSGRSYGLVYDAAGSLRQVVTPRGSAYTLHLTTSLSFYRLRLALPLDSIALQIRLDEQGKLLAMTQPGHGGTLVYEYNDKGQVISELYGRGFTHYTYFPSGLIRSAKTKHNHEDMKTDYRYHAGLVKEMKIRYGPKSKTHLHNVRLRYNYDVSARLRKIEGEINGNTLKEVLIRFDNQTGVLQLISDLRIIRNNILETMLQNPKKHFVNTRKEDNYGRLAEIDMTLRSKTVFMMRLSYDNRNRISERLIEISGKRIGFDYSYNSDGEIQKVEGIRTWVYMYDENGNMVSHTEQGVQLTLTYDECDRVTSVGPSIVEYDERGFVVKIHDQNFDYNTKGQLVSVWNQHQKWSFTLAYDHLDRVSVFRDHHNNVTQIIYGRPDLPHLITHLHFPYSGATVCLLYDDMNQLIAIDQPEGRFFVATDQTGAPVAIFDDLGSLIRSQLWSPFGRLIEPAGSNMWVGLGPWGKFYEPRTGIVFFGGHAYHPELMQWMTPQWSRLTHPEWQVTDVFVYRFMANNPVATSLLGHHNQYYTDVSEWLEVYGIEVNRMLGSEYHENTLIQPQPPIGVERLGASEVASGLLCQYEAGVKHLHDLSFFSQSHLQHRMGVWNGASISRQASVFGPGVLVSEIGGRVLVTVMGENDFSWVVGDVIRTVLNNSVLLDVFASHHGLDTFYFLKSSRSRKAEDVEHLQRLSGVFNLTIGEHDHGHEVRMSTPTAHLVVVYGEQLRRARNRVLSSLEEEAARLAWQQETALIRAGRSGTHSWTGEEAQQLLRDGRVTGYVTSHFHEIDRYPTLAADPSNIVFKHESARKRRKSRRKARKRSWRQRRKGGVVAV